MVWSKPLEPFFFFRKKERLIFDNLAVICLVLRQPHTNVLQLRVLRRHHLQTDGNRHTGG